MQNVIKIGFKCPIVLHQHKERKELLRTRLFFFPHVLNVSLAPFTGSEFIRQDGGRPGLRGKCPCVIPRASSASPHSFLLKCRSAPTDSFPTRPGAAAAAHHCCSPRSFFSPDGPTTPERQSRRSHKPCLWHTILIVHLQKAALHRKLCLAIAPRNVPGSLNYVL